MAFPRRFLGYGGKGLRSAVFLRGVALLKFSLLKFSLLKSGLLKFGFEGGDDGEGALQGVREGLAEMEVGDAEGFGEVAQGVLDDNPVFGLAEQDADGGLIGGVAQQFVHGGEVEVRLAGIGRLEVGHFEVHDDEAAQGEVVEEQVQVEVFAADFEVILAADEAESGSHLQKELAQVVQQATFQVAFAGIFAEGNLL